MATQPAEELSRLRECVRDLVALSSVRAWWVERPPAAIAESLRDLLLSMLTADVVHVVLHDRESHTAHVASGGDRDTPGHADGTTRLSSCPIGIEGDLGRITVGSLRDDFPTALESLLLRVTANEVAVALQHSALILRHERAERLLADRVQQQAAVARLGLRALNGLRVDVLLGEAVGAVRDTLHVDRCGIFELGADSEILVLRVGDGWQRSADDSAQSDDDIAPGPALLSTEPVIVEDVRRDERFAVLSNLPGSRVTSWISVMVPGTRRPYSVLGAHTSERRVFTGDDVYFLQAVANLLGAAHERHETEAERERLLDATARAQADAEKASRVKSDFLGLMSHELRTPLNAIGGYTQLMEEGIRGPITEEQRLDLARIQRSKSYLLSLIDNVLGYLKLENGRVSYDVAEIDVADIIDAVEELTRPLIDAKHIRYERRCERQGMLVRADRAKLQQIVLNLISNAIKFTDSGGSLIVDCDHDDAGLRIRVVDSGWGIPSDRLEYVFEPFTQMDSTRARSSGGTGLGLTISRDFARGMGGELSVDSEPGRGSVFTIALPVAM
jgi:signal transduction histidine kinase